MTLVKYQNPEIQEQPNITVDTVQHYSRHTKELNATQVSKALKFVKYDCIKYLGQFQETDLFKDIVELYPDARNMFVCLPLNRNKTHEFLGLSLDKMPYPDILICLNCGELLYLNREKKIWEHTHLENLCLNPLPKYKDYNFSEYIMYKDKTDTFTCNCQSYVTKAKRGDIIEKGANCSHTLALFYAFSLKRFQ